MTVNPDVGALTSRLTTLYECEDGHLSNLVRKVGLSKFECAHCGLPVRQRRFAAVTKSKPKADESERPNA